ncbi:hypothetical protein PPL_05315 [Heterostelium album PN500]|uniref:Uncharacterized protein n=1 Tax=Heterostelium pallidum (strain ATCC 26659 / Pp 5 / PN500) TaxID=670386 RepID=D3BBC6_HETP5|nr:hypothetical protein PPL_05315 [Heterostelium album PN500]EFA81333.1 hypothetical protein PPL_05315 [Heterostelium album PN500]|eukprot:XP_020433451.1 hypothetical protein PPL_05315 [Heterostelium album PN500]
MKLERWEKREIFGYYRCIFFVSILEWYFEVFFDGSGHLSSTIKAKLNLANHDVHSNDLISLFSFILVEFYNLNQFQLEYLTTKLDDSSIFPKVSFKGNSNWNRPN